MTGRLHDDELDVDEALVRRLLATLPPPLATSYDGLPLRRFVASGSSNALFLLGPATAEGLLVRLPRQPGGTATIEKEQRWLPHAAAHLPVAVPEVVAVGEPGFGYPERWSVVRYLPGDQPVVPTPGEAPRLGLADDLAGVVRALRRLPVPDDALADPALRWYRGDPLAAMADDMRDYLAGCRPLAGDPAFDLDLDEVAARWAAVLALPEASRRVSPRWYHGDLNAENLLVRDARLAAVLDFGGLSVGDPVVDLTVAWQLLDPVARASFRDAVGVDDVTWRLAAGWALVLGVMGAPYYWHTLPDRCRRGLHTARAALADLA